MVTQRILVLGGRIGTEITIDTDFCIPLVDAEDAFRSSFDRAVQLGVLFMREAEALEYLGSPFSETGSVGWMDPVDMSEAHESGNTGDTTIDLIWMTLK